MLFKYITAALVAGASLAFAADKCNAQANLDLCLKNSNRVAQRCGGTDYKCLCDTARIVLDCYKFCPDDEGKAIQESVVVSWCETAGGGRTSTPQAASTTTTTSAVASDSAVPPPSSTPDTTNTGRATSTEAPTPTESDGSPNGTESGARTSETDGGSVNISPAFSFGALAAGAAAAIAALI
ncbi:hypothetical protein BDZ91DRAFT_779525 [Kalaharituber pfeilii]|nr:hypothetical protein BDZ91DRAFT_779525 [Kalaharituber pfeilii]